MSRLGGRSWTAVLLLLTLLLLGLGPVHSDPDPGDREEDEEGSGYDDEDYGDDDDFSRFDSTPVLPTRVVPALQSPVPSGGTGAATGGRTKSPSVDGGRGIYVRSLASK